MSELETPAAAAATDSATTGNAAYAQVLQGIDQLEEGASWADIMAREPVLLPSCDESSSPATSFDPLPDTDSSPSKAAAIRQIPTYPPFTLVLNQLPADVDSESLFYLFGGDKYIKDMTIKSDDELGKKRIKFEFYEREGCVKAIQYHNTPFQNFRLKVYFMRPGSDASNTPASAPHFTRNYRQDSYNDRRGGGGVRYSGRKSSGSQYGSQVSLRDSNDARQSRDSMDRDRFRDNDNYSSNSRRISNDRGGHFSDRGGSRRGDRGGSYTDRYSNMDRSSGHGRNYYDRGGLQKSPSYGSRSQRQYSKYDDFSQGPPAPIVRSYTSDSHNYGRSRDSFDNRRFDSRASSILSINEGNEQSTPIIRKASSNPFGEAKPVDTAAKMKEIEEKIERDKKEMLKESSATPVDSSELVASTSDIRKEKERERDAGQISSVQHKTMTFVPSASKRGGDRGGGGGSAKDFRPTSIAKRPSTGPFRKSEEGGQSQKTSSNKSSTSETNSTSVASSSQDKTAKGSESSEKSTDSSAHKPPHHTSSSSRRESGGRGGRGSTRDRDRDQKHRNKPQLTSNKSSG